MAIYMGAGPSMIYAAEGCAPNFDELSPRSDPAPEPLRASRPPPVVDPAWTRSVRHSWRRSLEVSHASTAAGVPARAVVLPGARPGLGRSWPPPRSARWPRTPHVPPRASAPRPCLRPIPSTPAALRRHYQLGPMPCAGARSALPRGLALALDALLPTHPAARRAAPVPRRSVHRRRHRASTGMADASAAATARGGAALSSMHFVDDMHRCMRATAATATASMSRLTAAEQTLDLQGCGTAPCSPRAAWTSRPMRARWQPAIAHRQDRSMPRTGPSRVAAARATGAMYPPGHALERRWVNARRALTERRDAPGNRRARLAAVVEAALGDPPPS